MNPHNYGHLTFDKEAKNIQWERTAFLTNGAGLTGGQHAEKCKLKYLSIAGGIARWLKPLWKSVWQFLRKLDIVLPEDSG